MAFTLSSNMSLIIPTVGSEPGPTYASDVNASLTLIDQHDHSLGRGVQITPAGMNINATLDFQGNTASNVLTLGFTNQVTASSTPSSVSVAPGAGTGLQDLWYTDGTGTPIQITKSGIVNVVASSIPGESYAAGTFIWDQTQSGAPTTPANFDIGSVTLRPNIALTTFGVTLSPPAAIASAYTLFLPNNPSLLAGTAFLTIDTSGNIVGSIQTALGITAANLAADSVTTTKILNDAVTNAKLSPTVRATVLQINSTTITASGTYTVPAGVYTIFALGAGGGGGGGSGSSVTGGPGGNGGNGAMPFMQILSTTPAASISVTIGAGGGGGNSANDGGQGSDTNFGTLTFKGGNGGLGGTSINKFNPPPNPGDPYGPFLNPSNQISNQGGMGGFLFSGSFANSSNGQNSNYASGGGGGAASVTDPGGGGGGAGFGNGQAGTTGGGSAGANSSAGGGGCRGAGQAGGGGSGQIIVYYFTGL